MALRNKDIQWWQSENSDKTTPQPSTLLPLSHHLPLNTSVNVVYTTGPLVFRENQKQKAFPDGFCAQFDLFRPMAYIVWADIVLCLFIFPFLDEQIRLDSTSGTKLGFIDSKCFVMFFLPGTAYIFQPEFSMLLSKFSLKDNIT